MRWALGMLLWVGCADPELADGPSDGPVDTGPEAPPLDPDADSYVPPGYAPVAPVRAIFLGDSITAGYGLNERKNAYDDLLMANNDNKWPDYIGDTLTERYGDLEVLNVSVPGATTDSLLAAQLGRIESNLGATVSGETMVFITIGGNDIVGALVSLGDPFDVADEVVDNLAEIVDWFQDPARFPDGARVYITNVYEPTDGTGQVEECFFGLDLSAFTPAFDQLEADSRLLAEDLDFSLVDLRGHFQGHGFRHDEDGPWYDDADPTLWFQDDCIHPNARGHHELRRLFLSAVDGVPLLLEP